LDCPHYTRPEIWREQGVPDTLLSGNHAHIEGWRREQRLTLTREHRPELLEAARQAGSLTAADEAFLRSLTGKSSQQP
ncbi:MAG: tRNA (guanosine(37)-N1)-methyltransferase TrmD, partial [Polaromonas sp.]|nr:tRNA (guanosine(37)-N1)-methyltransferase TrmD [Polaromonas sp.]